MFRSNKRSKGEFSHLAHRAPPRPLVRSRPLVRPRPGVRMSSLRRWRVSRQASPFLSLPLPSTSASYSELVDVLSRATEKLALDWPDEPRESQASKLDERFLSGAHSKPERRKLPFFSDLHQEISGSWKQPFSSCLTNAAAADFINLMGSVEQGYTAMPVVEDTLASHLSPSLAPSWKSRPLLPSSRVGPISALIGKYYIAAGQAGMALHTMAILQA